MYQTKTELQKQKEVETWIQKWREEKLRTNLDYYTKYYGNYQPSR